MRKVETIYCPNCGSHAAERIYLKRHEIVQTQCPQCDYFLSSCMRTGSVLATHLSGFLSQRG